MSSVPVTVPSVGESISEGILSRWHKADGSLVSAGEPLFELETDKATSNVPAADSGVLRIAVPEGETVAVGATVATIDPADPAATTTKQDRPAQPTTGKAGRNRRRKVPPSRPSSEPRPPAPEPTRATTPGNQTLSPAVRRLAAEEGVDVTQVPATGPGGRLTKGDVLAYLDTPGPGPPNPPPPRLLKPLGQPRPAPPPHPRPPAKPASA